MKYIILILFFIFFIPLNVAFGHGLGGDQAPPINFDGLNVTVSTILDPYDITVGDLYTANMEVRFFDLNSNKNFKEVTYRIQVWRSGDLLANKLFYAVNGQLDVEIRPVYDCIKDILWKCTTYFGAEHTISGGLFAQGEGRPLIQGPIFDKGGLYNLKVDIEGAISPKTLVAQRLSFETFVSVAQEQNFILPTASAEIPIVIKTYYDQVDNFAFSPIDNSMTFDMPFDWNPEYISLVQVVHEEIRVPKFFDPYYEGKHFNGFVNGVELSNRILLVDPYSFEDYNVIHFLISSNELERINSILGEDNFDSNLMTFKLVPTDSAVKNSIAFNVGSSASATINWDATYSTGDEIAFQFEFFDNSGDLLKDVLYGYRIETKSGDVLYENVGSSTEYIGIWASEGIDIQNLVISNEGEYKVSVSIFGTSTLNLDTTLSGLGSTLIEIGSLNSNLQPVTPTESSTEPTVSIPNWIKNNAKFWYDGDIDDPTFITGIQYLIQNEIIIIPPTDQTQINDESTIPSWVKNNAKFWYDGVIDDSTFAAGIQYLIQFGIIVI